MAEIYWLSANDRQSLKELLREHERRSRNTTGRIGAQDIEHQEYMTPEVYVARTPAGGIPALDENTTGTSTTALGDDVPGYAECDIYRIIDDETGGDNPVLKPVEELSKRVHNLSIFPIDEYQLIQVIRDKFGNWYAHDIWIGTDTVGTGTNDDEFVEIDIITGICPIFESESTGTADEGGGGDVTEEELEEAVENSQALLLAASWMGF